MNSKGKIVVKVHHKIGAIFVFVFVYVFRYYCINLHSRSEFHIFMRFDIKNDKENKISNAGFW